MQYRQTASVLARKNGFCAKIQEKIRDLRPIGVQGRPEGPRTPVLHPLPGKAQTTVRINSQQPTRNAQFSSNGQRQRLNDLPFYIREHPFDFAPFDALRLLRIYDRARRGQKPLSFTWSLDVPCWLLAVVPSFLFFTPSPILDEEPETPRRDHSPSGPGRSSPARRPNSARARCAAPCSACFLVIPHELGKCLPSIATATSKHLL